MKKYLITFLLAYAFVNTCMAQDFHKFSIAVGPVFGINLPSVDELNSEISKAGFPNFSKGEFISTGFSGFIDVPVIKGLRIGGLGYGYSNSVSSRTISNTEKFVELSYSMGGVSLEYSGKFSDLFDYTLGGVLGYGTLRLNFSNFGEKNKNWNINNYASDTTGSDYYTKKLSAGVYSINPQAGIGFHPLKYIYLKLNAGYLFSVNTKWKLEEVFEVSNVPSGIKADGFHFNLGIYVGLFVQ